MTDRSEPSSNSTFRIIIAKPGLDGHDRGAKIVATALRDAGFEVIYLGLFGTPEGIAEAALQEDADAIGLSLLSGAHMALFRDLIAELKARGLDDVIVFGGGVIPDGDVAELKRLGVGELFTPGASTGAIVSWLETQLAARESAI
jgi:methylmalonyl-CoA mutase, C-terminal domain